MHARIRTIGVLAAALAGVLAATAASADSLVDVPEDHPFHDEIHWAWRLDIADGYDDHTFRPTAPVSRQAFLAFLHRTWEAMGSPPVPVDGPAGFDDVPTTSGFHDDIIWAAQAGIASGHADGTFRPTATVRRQAAVAFLHRFWSHLDQADPAGPRRTLPQLHRCRAHAPVHGRDCLGGLARDHLGSSRRHVPPRRRGRPPDRGRVPAPAGHSARPRDHHA